MSWYIPKIEVSSGQSKSIDLDTLLEKADEILTLNGVLTLSLDAPKIPGAVDLQLSFENGFGIFALGYDDGEDYDTQSYFGGKNSKKVEIFGNEWNGEMVIDNAFEIKSILREFFESGAVGGFK